MVLFVGKLSLPDTPLGTLPYLEGRRWTRSGSRVKEIVRPENEVVRVRRSGVDLKGLPVGSVERREVGPSRG